MGILQTLTGTKKCPECEGIGDPTDWLPSPGNDPMMREFTCLDCSAKFYYRVKDLEQLFNIRARATALLEAQQSKTELSKTDKPAYPGTALSTLPEKCDQARLDTEQSR